MAPVPEPAPSATEPPQALDFTALFNRELVYVWNSLRRLGVAYSDLEDLTQQVFLAVYTNRAQFDSSRPVRPWLFGFALNTASNYRRLARHRVTLLPSAQDISDPQPSADEQLLAKEQRELTELALQRVELERRAVLILHEIDGQSMPEIAQALGLKLNTAYSRLRLARQDFERAYRRLSARRGAP